MLSSKSSRAILNGRAIVILVVAAAIFAAPCIYDVASQEPSPLVAFVTAASTL